MKKAVFSVTVDGADVTQNFTPHIISLSVTDRAGVTSDSATIELDDTDGRIVMPQPGAQLRIMLGWRGGAVAEVFSGVTDKPTAKGGRNGRTISITAKGMDTRGKAKEGQRRHFDDTTIGDALKKVGEYAGIDVKVDDALASISRDYIALDNESFVAFGERLAREVGGTFKIVGDKAILAERNGGKSASGEPLPTVRAAWGDNLHSYSMTPLIGRPSEQKVAARWFDKKKGEYKVKDADTGTDGARSIKELIYATADEAQAGDVSKSGAKEADRRSGGGSVVIEGNVDAQPEGICNVTGCRPGVDGAYRIESVQHDYSRSGFITTLQLRQPKEGAGKDSR